MSRVTTIGCDRCDADITEGVTLSARRVAVDKDGEHNYLGSDLPIHGVDLCARCWAVVLAKIVEKFGGAT